MTTSLLFPIGSSKSKQSAQFDPARQVHTGKVQTCRERSNRTLGDRVYPAGNCWERFFLLLEKQTLPGSAKYSPAALGADTQLPVTNSCLASRPRLAQEELSWGFHALPLFLTWLYLVQAAPPAQQHTASATSNCSSKFKAPSRISESLQLRPRHIQVLPAFSTQGRNFFLI